MNTQTNLMNIACLMNTRMNLINIYNVYNSLLINQNKVSKKENLFALKQALRMQKKTSL